ncbi:MAG: hypothetical protein AAFX86_15380, partial [Pseudomonadota bacterium]
MIVDQMVQAMWLKHVDGNDRRKLMVSALAGMIDIAPRDPLEGMMVAQLLAAHNAAMECYRRAMIPDQAFEGRKENLNQANKLTRTWTMLLDALNKRRGKGQQKVTVKHVHVNEGGQAIVGNVTHSEGRGVDAKIEEQPHAKQSGDAQKPPLPCEDEGWDTLPVARDGEWSMPDARREFVRRAEGE